MIVDFWFDFSCPYAYLGFTQLPRLRAAGWDVHLCPMLLGGVFRAWGTPQNLAVALSPAEQSYGELDRQRYADLFGVPLVIPKTHPKRTVEALRALLACPASTWDDVASSVYRAYWVEDAQISDPATLREVLRRASVDADDVVEKAHSETIKAELRERTDRAIELGIFGAPTFFSGPDIYWGQDRIEQLLGVSGAPASQKPAAELFLDPRDPFAHVAIAEARRWVDATIFPISEAWLGRTTPSWWLANPAKARWLRTDLIRWSRRLRVPARTEHFAAPFSTDAEILEALAKQEGRPAELSPDAIRQRAQDRGVFRSGSLVVEGQVFASPDRYFFAGRLRS